MHASVQDLTESCYAAHVAAVAVTPAAVAVQIIAPESMVGYMEQAKGSNITRVFEDAYKSPLSIVILVCVCSMVAAASSSTRTPRLQQHTHPLVAAAHTPVEWNVVLNSCCGVPNACFQLCVFLLAADVVAVLLEPHRVSLEVWCL